MSMISEQVKELRIAAVYKEHSLKMLLEQAACTIESLSTKLQEENMKDENKRAKKHLKYGFCPDCGSPVGRGASTCFDCGSILDWDLLKEDSEQSKENCVGWILCKDRLPTKEESIKNDNRFILDDGNRRYGGLFDYEKKCFVQFDFWNGLVEDKCAIAWQPLPEPYHDP